MVQISELETERLILRQWGKDDLPHFAELNADPIVMKYFPSILSETESNKLAKRMMQLIAKNGWGFWAAECKLDHNFIGFIGLHKCAENLPFSPAVEIGWRLSQNYWRKGYATEAAIGCLYFAFGELNLNEIVSFASLINHRSIAVMQRIGMVNAEDNFYHPEVKREHALSEHALYKITKEQWST